MNSMNLGHIMILQLHTKETREKKTPIAAGFVGHNEEKN